MMKILIISPSWIGDTIMSHSMYQLLVKKYCWNIKIDVITTTWCQDVFHYIPEINKILLLPYKHGIIDLSKCYKFGKYLKSEKYQQAIILPNSFKSALIPFFANIPIRTGWRGEMRYGVLNDLRILNKKSFPLMIQRYAALTYDNNYVKNFYKLPNPLPLPRLNIDKKEITDVLCKFNLENYTKSLIGLCPGTEFGPSKSWPHYHYITLAIQLINYGYYVIILGSPKDTLVNKFIKFSTLTYLQEHCSNLVGMTTLKEAIAIIASCKGIVSNDSGLMHIACALQRPAVVGLYGPSDPTCTPPLFKKSAIIHNTAKYHKTPKKSNLYGYHESLINIKPTQVLQVLRTLLS